MEGCASRFVRYSSATVADIPFGRPRCLFALTSTRPCALRRPSSLTGSTIMPSRLVDPCHSSLRPAMASNPTRTSPGPSLSFNDCKLSSTDVSALATHLRTLPLLRTVAEARVRAAAIALITFGGSSDGKDKDRRGNTPLHSASSKISATSVLLDGHDGLGNEYVRMVMDLVRQFLACFETSDTNSCCSSPVVIGPPVESVFLSRRRELIALALSPRSPRSRRTFSFPSTSFVSNRGSVQSSLAWCRVLPKKSASP